MNDPFITHIISSMLPFITLLMRMVIATIIVGINALVVFTLTFMLKDLDGPFDIFKRLRTLLCGVVYDLDGYVLVEPTKGIQGFFAKLFGCFWCLSTWVSLFMAAYAALFGVPWVFLLYIWLAPIAIAGLLYNHMR